MRISVDVTIIEKGLVQESKGYLRSSDIELADLLKYTKESLIVIADQVLKEEQSAGFDKKPIVVVDGRVGKPVQNVSPLGKIEYVSNQKTSKILIDTFDAILHRSKVYTGLYKKSNVVAWNGTQVANTREGLLAWIQSNPSLRRGDKIRFVNTQPYARRLELLGVTAQRQQNRREDVSRRKGSKKAKGTLATAPNGTYFLVSRMIRSKYKQNAGIKFTFVPGTSLGLTGSFKSGRKRNSSGRPYLYPSIILTVGDGGL